MGPPEARRRSGGGGAAAFTSNGIGTPNTAAAADPQDLLDLAQAANQAAVGDARWSERRL
jgi:hypothetical protein